MQKSTIKQNPLSRWPLETLSSGTVLRTRQDMTGFMRYTKEIEKALFSSDSSLPGLKLQDLLDAQLPRIQNGKILLILGNVIDGNGKNYTKFLLDELVCIAHVNFLTKETFEQAFEIIKIGEQK